MTFIPKLKIYTCFFAIGFFITGFVNCGASNLQIGVPTVNVGASTISFTIQWDNSWLVTTGANNWDGVWIFVKRQSCTNNIWAHALMSTTSGDHSITGGVVQVDAVTDGMGVFIRPSAAEIGNIASCTATLKLQTAPNLVDNFQVFGIEVVNVPQGDFYIGDGTRGTSQWGFYDVPAGLNAPKLITNAIQTAGLGAANQYAQYGSTGSLPGTFPLGWNKFYCMKYEISQQQYASFLNTLTYDQQAARATCAPNAAVNTLALVFGVIPSRNGIRIQTKGTTNNIPAVFGCNLNGNVTFNEAADGQNIACNWLNWPDIMAYMDWAALRPFTEFEFEKACRGTLLPTANENAWGTTGLKQAHSGSISNGGQASEVSDSTGTGLCAYGINSTANGPLRCGFAATATTSRVSSGGSYYGIMELSGNVAEQCLGGYNSNYSVFTTANGDGTLTAAGASNTAGWLVGSSTERGSDWYTTTVLFLNISDRAYMTSVANQTRNYRTGGRGVRSW